MQDLFLIFIRIVCSFDIQPFFAVFRILNVLIIHFMGFICSFSSEGLTFCMIMQDFAFDSILLVKTLLSTRSVKIGCQAN